MDKNVPANQDYGDHMSRTTMFIIGAVVVVLILWGLEALIVGHFMNQFSGQQAS